jgi:NTE family protein
MVRTAPPDGKDLYRNTRPAREFRGAYDGAVGWTGELLARFRRPQGVTLALGGGGARGLAHVGVLAALEEAGVAVQAVAGTSAGAVVGGMWAALGSAAATERCWREFFASGLLPPSLPDLHLAADVSSRDNLLLQFARRIRTGATVVLALERESLVAREDLDRVLEFLLPDVLIEDLPLPFAAVATDLATGEPVALRSGPLRLAVTASSAVPGVVTAVAVDGHYLIDGGVVADVPVGQARGLGPWPVVAVDAGEEPGDVEPDHLKVPLALMRAGVMTHRALRRRLLERADLVISPSVGSIHWSEFGRAEEALAAGRAAARAVLPAVLALARGRGRRR